MQISVIFTLFSYGVSLNYEGSWRYSLDDSDSCWKSSVSQCNRVLNIAHGGDWNIYYPYDSFPAFENAYNHSTDAIKGDFRVSLDNIGMIMHSSPIEIYESFNCYGKYVELTSSEELKQCRMAYTDYTFISASELLAWSEGKVNVMLCIKDSKDIARAIETLIENSATHRAFLELKINSFISMLSSPYPPVGYDQVYYIIEVYSSDDVATLLSLDTSIASKAFLYEFHTDDWSNYQEDIISVQSAGYRAVGVTRDSPITATLSNHLDLFNDGYKVAYTYNLTNAVEARQIVNTKHRIFPA